MAAARKDKQEARGRRIGLTRAQVVDAAVTLIDRDGLDAFSLRRLAGEIGCDPMSIYNHLANKDEILDAVVESVMAELAGRLGEPAATWQEQIRQTAYAFRSVSLEHPQVAVLMLTRRVLTDTPLELLREAIRPGIDAGLPALDALYALRSFTAMLTGSILRELGSGLSFGAADADHVAPLVERIVAADDPVLSPIAHDIADIDHAELFDFSIDLLIAGLEARTTPSAAER